MKRNEIKSLQDRIEYILERSEEARNSDKKLAILLWDEFYNVVEMLPVTRVSELEALIMAMPSQDAVKRVRAEFTHNGKYWPTKWEVANARHIDEKEWKIALGYAVREEANGQSKLGFKLPPIDRF